MISSDVKRTVMERSTHTNLEGCLERWAGAKTCIVGAESYLCQYNLNGNIMSSRVDTVEGAPRSRDLDSRGSATRGESASDDAVGDARVSGASRIRGVSRGGGVLSSDEGRSKGENGESGESEHGGECVV